MVAIHVSDVRKSMSHLDKKIDTKKADSAIQIIVYDIAGETLDADLLYQIESAILNVINDTKSIAIDIRYG